MNIYQTKKEKKGIPIAVKTCFSEEKLIKKLGAPLSNRSRLSTNPLFLNNFFLTPLFAQILQIGNPP